MPIAWNRVNTLLLVLVLLVLAGALARGVLGGPLDPPAPPASTMKTLEQVEPRIPISQPASAAGFPIVISQPGSYYLTGNITGVAGQDGIRVNAHDVTIDLNGLALNGVAGSGNGIVSSGWNTTVINGAVNGWGFDGVNATAENFHASRVQARNNGQYGFRVASGGLIEDSVATYNAVNGFYIASGGLIEDSVATYNGGSAIVLSGSGVVRGSYFSGNGGIGIDVSGSALVEDNDIVASPGLGIRLAGNGATVRNNTLARNGLGGIEVYGQTNRIEGNTLTGDPAAPLPIPYGIRVTGTHNFIVRNSASYNADNFDIGPSNTAGPEETGAATSPWSNVNY